MANKKMDALISKKNEIELRDFVLEPNQTIIETVRLNAYRSVIYDDIECQFESYLDELNYEELKFMLDKGIYDDIYHAYNNCDYTDSELLYSIIGDYVREYKKKYKESKKKK